MAVSDDMGYGNGLGGLPWPPLAEDMKRFRKKTMDQAVLMGRRTYDSLEKPLDGRLNLVLSKHLIPRKVSREEALELKCGTTQLIALSEVLNIHLAGRDLWVAGGDTVWAPFVRLADELHVTYVHGNWDTKLFLQDTDLELFTKTKSIEHINDHGIRCTFAVLTRE